MKFRPWFKFSISFAALGCSIKLISAMFVTSSKSELQSYLNAQKSSGKTVGFVATMGALHKGHMALIGQSKRETDVTICSIFVNPTQFNNPSDLEKYPRNLQRDLDLLEINHCDAVFTPTNEVMYAVDEKAKEYDFGGIEILMEGRFRPGHFNGVGTIIYKLAQLIEPDRAYFGKKDYQQLLVIERLVQIEKLPVKVVGCEIQREENGLAMSSRNERLSEEARNKSGYIYKQLQWARENFTEKSIPEIHSVVNRAFSAKPFFDLEYFAIVDAETMQPIESKIDINHVRAFIAVHVEGVRLIDNIALN